MTQTESKGFVGERFDPETGLHYLHARYYDPKLGLFTQGDWWDPTDPGVGTNRYSYALGDPINLSDPNGHAVFAAPLVGIAAELGFAAEVAFGVAALSTIVDRMAEILSEMVGEEEDEPTTGTTEPGSDPAVDSTQPGEQPNPDQDPDDREPGLVGKAALEQGLKAAQKELGVETNREVGEKMGWGKSGSMPAPYNSVTDRNKLSDQTLQDLEKGYRDVASELGDKGSVPGARSEQVGGMLGERGVDPRD